MVDSRRVTVARARPMPPAPGEALDAGTADGEQSQRAARHQLVNWRRSRA
jgi:hypothetical protein